MTSESARNRPCLMRTYIILLLIPSLCPNWNFSIFPFCSSHTHSHKKKSHLWFIALPAFSSHSLTSLFSFLLPIFNHLFSAITLLSLWHRHITIFFPLSLIHFFPPVSLLLFVSPTCVSSLLLSSLLIPSFLFHLHSHSSAVTVIYLLWSSCGIVLTLSKYHLIMMLVCFWCSALNPSVCPPAEAPCTERDASFSDQLWRSWQPS